MVAVESNHGGIKAFESNNLEIFVRWGPYDGSWAEDIDQQVPQFFGQRVTGEVQVERIEQHR
jgi:hypothetical protein